MAEIARKDLRVQGSRWSWYELGNGPVMVFLHGGGGTGKAFSAQIQYFSSHYRVLAPDLPGFGRSDRPPRIAGLSDIPPALWRWLDALNISTAILAGNSMGGRVALAAAAALPSRVSHLICLSVAGIHLPDVALGDPLAIDPAHFVQAMVHDPKRFRRLTPYRTLEDAKELSAGRKAYAEYQDQGGISARPEVDLTLLTMPTLLLWGRQDHIIPLAYGQALEASMINATLVVFEDVGHLPHMEAPTRTNQAIENFLHTNR